MRIEAAKVAVENAPVTPSLLASLRQSARLRATHYSTQIEGNRLTAAEVAEVVLDGQGGLRGRERDASEVRNYNRDYAYEMRELDPQQRRALELFGESRVVTSVRLAESLRLSVRQARERCRRWVGEGFLVVENPSNRARSYCLAEKWETIVTGARHGRG